MNLLSFFRPDEGAVLLPEDLNLPEYKPATELEVFASRVRQIVTGLDTQIADSEVQLEQLIARIADLKRIRDGQNLALRYMEGDI